MCRAKWALEAHLFFQLLNEGLFEGTAHLRGSLFEGGFQITFTAGHIPIGSFQLRSCCGEKLNSRIIFKECF